MRTLRYGLALFAAAAIGFPSQLAAQTTLGVKGGVNIASLSTADFGGFIPDFGTVTGDLDGTRTGLVVGGFASFSLGEMFFLQPEVLYSQKGGRGEITLEGTPVDWGFDIDYLSVPVLLGVAFPLESSTVEPRLFAGPEVNFEIGCSIVAEFAGVSASEDCGDITESVDFGLVFGAGIAFGLDSFDLLLDARYGLGLTDIGSGDGQSLKNRAWQFMAGVGFPIGG
jgi:hypothetical protein